MKKETGTGNKQPSSVSRGGGVLAPQGGSRAAGAGGCPGTRPGAGAGRGGAGRLVLRAGPAPGVSAGAAEQAPTPRGDRMPGRQAGYLQGLGMPRRVLTPVPPKCAGGQKHPRTGCGGARRLAGTWVGEGENPGVLSPTPPAPTTRPSSTPSTWDNAQDSWLPGNLRPTSQSLALSCCPPIMHCSTAGSACSMSLGLLL